MMAVASGTTRGFQGLEEGGGGSVLSGSVRSIRSLGGRFLNNRELCDAS